MQHGEDRKGKKDTERQEEDQCGIREERGNLNRSQCIEGKGTRRGYARIVEKNEDREPKKAKKDKVMQNV